MRIGESEGQLGELARELESVRERRKELEGKESGVLLRLAQSEQELELAEELVQALQKREKRGEDEIERLRRAIAETEQELEERRTVLARRLRGIYLHGNPHSLEVLLSAEGFGSAFTRLRGLRLVAARDRDLYVGVRGLRQSLYERQKRLEMTVAEVSHVRAEAEREEAAIARERRSRQGLLGEVRAEAKTQERLERELEESAAELEALIASLERRRRETVAQLEAARTAAQAQAMVFRETPGTLLWPVEGQIISTFGMKTHPKYGTSTRNNGIDIRAPLGTPVRCVGDGSIAYADRFLGYGKLIVVEHGGGVYTLYGHLAEISVMVGAPVAKRQILGTVGDTGSLEGPKLHFEVREGGTPVDPLSWLAGE